MSTTNTVRNLGVAVDSISISPSGRDLVGIDDRGLRIFDIEDLDAKPRLIPQRKATGHHDKVHWSPHGSNDNWIASLHDQECTLWDVSKECERYHFSGHVKAVTDLDWSPFSPNQIATCSIDKTTIVWDLRRPRLAEAIVINYGNACVEQVKWNCVQSSLLATAEGVDLILWDLRTAKRPIRVIKTDDQHNISSLDWNPSYKENVTTSSSAITGGIKMWNTEREGNPLDRTIQTGNCIKRVRHTPFGSGIMALSLNGMSLDLYDRRTHKISDRDAYKKPESSFNNLRQPIAEFFWRSSGDFAQGSDGHYQDERGFELICFGGTRALNIQAMNQDIMSRVGWGKGDSYEKKPQRAREGAKEYSFSFKNVPSNSFESEHTPRQVMIHDARLADRQIVKLKRSIEGGKNKFLAWLEKELFLLEDVRSGKTDIAIDSKSAEEVVTFNIDGPWQKNGEFAMITATFGFTDEYPESGPPRIELSSSSIERETLNNLKTAVASLESDCRSAGASFLRPMLDLLCGRRPVEHFQLESNGLENTQGSTEMLAGTESSWNIGIKPSPILEEDDEDDPLIGNVAPTGGEGTIVVNDQTRIVRLPSPVFAVFRFGTGGRSVHLSFTKRKVLLGEGFNDPDTSDFNPKEIRESWSRFKTNNPNSNGTLKSLLSARTDSSAADLKIKEHHLPVTIWLDRLSTSSNKDAGISLDNEDKSGKFIDAERSTESSAFTNISKSVLRLVPEVLFSATNIFRLLAGRYILSGDAADAARQNFEVCVNLSREIKTHDLDVVTSAWQATAIMLGEDSVKSASYPFLDPHVFERELLAKDIGAEDAMQYLKSEAKLRNSRNVLIPGRVQRSKPAVVQWLSRLILKYFEARHDIQTLAVLSCVFQSAESQYSKTSTKLKIASSQFKRVPTYLRESEPRGSTKTTNRFDIKYKNKDLFSKESGSAMVLMDSRQKSNARLWRQQYALQLDAWDLPIQQSEILKYNGAVNDVNTGWSREAFVHVTRGQVSTQECVLCDQPLDGLCGSCAQCGSALHFECLQLIQQLGNGDMQCSEGCGKF